VRDLIREKKSDTAFFLIGVRCRELGSWSVSEKGVGKLGSEYYWTDHLVETFEMT
jgi:hypothetical protein